ncbi:hypothetical protein D3C72_2125030 [compost metagenome]
MGAGLHQGGAIGERLFEAGVGHEGQVADDQRALVTALHSRGVVGHVGHADRQGAVVTLQDHAEGVAHQQYIHAGLAGSLGEGGIVGRQHGDFLAFELELLQGGQGHIRHENVLIGTGCNRHGATGRL